MSTAPEPRELAAELYKKFFVAAAVFFIIFEVGYFANSSPPFDALGYLIGRDFVNIWTGWRAIAAGDPASFYDFQVYNTVLREIFGPSFPEHNWSYPPHLLLFTWPFGLMPYLTAYAVWCAVGVALLAAVAYACGMRRNQWLFLALAPATLVNIFAGQNGFFTAALLIGGLTVIDRRPVLAGVLFGLLTIKPQLGLLLPLMLVLTWRWTVIASATVTVLALVALSAAVFGPEVWQAYVAKAIPVQQEVMTKGSGIFLAMMPTAFMNMRTAGLGLGIAWTAQILVSVLAIAAVIWTYAQRRDAELSTALLVTASFLVTPYAFNYDMVVFGWLIANLRDRPDSTPVDHRLALAVWTLPISAMLLGVAGIPGSVLVLLAFAVRLLWRLKHAPLQGPVTAGLVRA